MNMKHCMGLVRRVQLAAAAVLLLGEFSCTYAQQRPNPAETPARLQSGRENDVSELAKENNDRVAASATLIQSILLKDPGLLVELKRLIAKEATENGQIVGDTELSDTAVFDRLARDVVFRSAATRLRGNKPCCRSA